MKDYTQYEYQTLISRMTTLLQEQDGWGEGYQSSTGQTLIQLVADTTDMLHYMLERRSLEGFLDSARLRSSVFARSSELGYRPRRIRGHVGELELVLMDGDGEPAGAVGQVIIRALTQLTFDGRLFFTTEDAVIDAGNTSVKIKVREGELTTVNFDLARGDLVEFADYSKIDEDYVTVFNGGEEYYDVMSQRDVNHRALSFLHANDPYYDIKFSVDGMRIEFGDNEYGKKPSGLVSVHYASVESTDNPILVIGSKFEFVNPVVDFEYPTVEYEYELKNTTRIEGGQAEESLDSIRRNAVLYHKTNGRATTNEDYEYWVKRSGIGRLADASCFGEEEMDSLVYNANNVYITYATERGTKLTVAEEQELREYMHPLKTSQAHLVLNQANNIMLRLNTEMRKRRDVPIPNSQAYKIVRDFLTEYFKIKDGSIGGTFQLSDLMDAFYDITINRNGVVYQLCDFVKVTADAVVEFDFPAKTTECFVEIGADYTPSAGDEFVLNLENLTCLATVEANDTVQDILLKMRDVVRQVTPFDAIVHLSSIALDSFGNPYPVEINPRVGYSLLIGHDTPYLSNDSMVTPAMIGTAIVGVSSYTPEFTATQYYYSTPAGRRPMIPVSIGSRVRFTAPTDTAVRVYTRTVATNPATEVLLTTIAAGAAYDRVFNDVHAVIFEYVNNSTKDVTATVTYPSYAGVKYGLRIRANDNFGSFRVNTTSGDLSEYVSVDYHLILPVPDFTGSTSSDIDLVKLDSVRIADSSGNILFTSDSAGRLYDAGGNLVSSGSVNARNGVVVLPKTMPAVSPAGKYLLLFDQDRFENLTVSSSDVIKLIPPPVKHDSTETSLSTLIVG